MKVADETGQLIAFGRAYISNVRFSSPPFSQPVNESLCVQPDLPLRLMKNIPLTPWDTDLFYIPEEPHGYIDYPVAQVD